MARGGPGAVLRPLCVLELALAPPRAAASPTHVWRGTTWARALFEAGAQDEHAEARALGLPRAQGFSAAWLLTFLFRRMDFEPLLPSPAAAAAAHGAAFPAGVAEQALRGCWPAHSAALRDCARSPPPKQHQLDALLAALSQHQLDALLAALSQHLLEAHESEAERATRLYGAAGAATPRPTLLLLQLGARAASVADAPLFAAVVTPAACADVGCSNAPCPMVHLRGGGAPPGGGGARLLLRTAAAPPHTSLLLLPAATPHAAAAAAAAADAPPAALPIAEVCADLWLVRTLRGRTQAALCFPAAWRWTRRRRRRRGSPRSCWWRPRTCSAPPCLALLRRGSSRWRTRCSRPTCCTRCPPPYRGSRRCPRTRSRRRWACSPPM
jgi:hypothetical protein